MKSSKCSFTLWFVKKKKNSWELKILFLKLFFQNVKCIIPHKRKKILTYSTNKSLKFDDEKSRRRILFFNNSTNLFYEINIDIPKFWN